MTFDASNRKQVREKEKFSKLISRDNEVILATIMSTMNGRRWMHDKFERGHIFSTPFHNDPIQMGFNCGMQSVCLQEFLEVVRLCPEEYLQMMREANERQIANDSKARETNADFDREESNKAEAQRIGLMTLVEEDENGRD